MKFVFVVNPRAGGLSARRSRRRLADLLAASDLEHEIQITQHAGHAFSIARIAAEAGSAVVAVGGDGTAHDVASGIIESGVDVPMAMLPMGTGNDFAKMLDVPVSLESALYELSYGRCARVDYGSISWSGPAGTGSGYFINIGGAGFDAKVAAAASSFKLLTGTPRYVAAVLRTLRSWRAPRVLIDLFVEDETVYSYHGPLFLALVGNGVCSGGGFYLTPDASILDGMLDACIIRGVSVPRVLTLLPRALSGTHVHAPEVQMEKIDRMSINSSQALAIQADGEILTEEAYQLEIGVVPAGLRILGPVRM